MLKEELLNKLKERKGLHTDTVDVCGLLPGIRADVTISLLRDLIREGKVLQRTYLRNNFEVAEEQSELTETPDWMKKGTRCYY